jgi:hypothetical protein
VDQEKQLKQGMLENSESPLKQGSKEQRDRSKGAKNRNGRKSRAKNIGESKGKRRRELDRSIDSRGRPKGCVLLSSSFQEIKQRELEQEPGHLSSFP